MMITDFIIQWKDDVKNKTELASKVKDMLNSLFSDVSIDSFSYITDNNTTHTLKYYLTEKDNKVYLQIKSFESEDRAAHTLSSIREVISKGKHRKDFLIICTYDEASLSYCCRLMKCMGIFERHLRQMMYLITTKEFGVDWIKKTFSKEMIEGIKERTHGGLSDEKITESAFEFLDYGEITTYLFSKRYFECSPEQLIEDTLSEQSLTTLSKEEIITIISSHRKTSLWDKLFSNISGVSEEKIDKIREYRNDVMHHHTLNNSRFKDIRKEVQAADKIVTQAIGNIENKIYTEEESRLVYSSIGYVIAEMMKSINFSAMINIPDITSVIENAFKNFSLLSKTLSDTFSRLPDYSQLINNIAIANLPLNDSIEIENITDKPKLDKDKDEDENENENDINP